MKRKQEQGSMQMQGEVQELAIEEFITNFPSDTLKKLKKAQRVPIVFKLSIRVKRYKIAVIIMK